jgi:murein tripeptide amidase MpaA
MLATLVLALTSAVLPPELPWHGKSESLLLAAGDPWATPFEASGGTRTPSYAQTLAFLRRLAATNPELSLSSLGRSGEGRDVWMAIAARGGAATPEAVRRLGRPILLVQAGIHAGEIDGKDAGLMLLRDALATKTKAALLDQVSLLFIPMLNVDGHERSSETNRINQRGPERMGWRTNATNLNLNRDYAKADTPEIRGVLRALLEWTPTYTWTFTSPTVPTTSTTSRTAGMRARTTRPPSRAGSTSGCGPPWTGTSSRWATSQARSSR